MHSLGNKVDRLKSAQMTENKLLTQVDTCVMSYIKNILGRSIQYCYITKFYSISVGNYNIKRKMRLKLLRI